MSTAITQRLTPRVTSVGTWFALDDQRECAHLLQLPAHALSYEVLDNEEAVADAMLEELMSLAAAKAGDLVMVLLGGRGAQGLHRKLGQLAQTNAIDALLARLNLFMQDALSPLRPGNGFSFERDFERLLGAEFLRKVKSFSRIDTAPGVDVAVALQHYMEKISALGGIDIFFLGLGPEAEAASHLCYIKPDSGARLTDVAGMLPVSASILDHHISKFKAGGSVVAEGHEAECRLATHVLTLGPAAILGARRIVQSIVDASTAPAKRASFRRLVDTEISLDQQERAAQVQSNPGLLVRLHPNVRTLILPDLLEA